jgi:hypothetical protein
MEDIDMHPAEITMQARMNAESTLVYPIPGIKIDPDRLVGDLKCMEEELWTAMNLYGPDVKHWHGIALYAVSNDPHDLRTADRLPVYKTAAGEKCPYICNELLPQFGAPCLRVQFLRLKAGTKIGRHRDLGENRFIKGILRIHIPVITNDKVLMYVDGNPYYFPVGTAWYFDATAPHSVENNGEQDRFHLVADLKLTDKLDKLLKPLTMSDRLRFTCLTSVYYGKVAKYFFRYIRTSRGRARIRARAAMVFRLPGSQ